MTCSSQILSYRVRPMEASFIANAGASAPVAQRLHMARRRAGVELPRPADLVFRVADHFIELRDPADRAGERKDRREEAHRNADGALHDAGIEVDVRIE